MQTWVEVELFGSRVSAVAENALLSVASRRYLEAVSAARNETAGHRYSEHLAVAENQDRPHFVPATASRVLQDNDHQASWSPILRAFPVQT